MKLIYEFYPLKAALVVAHEIENEMGIELNFVELDDDTRIAYNYPDVDMLINGLITEEEYTERNKLNA